MTAPLRPYRFLGESALATLQTEIEQATTRWCRRWRRAEEPLFRSTVCRAAEGAPAFDELPAWLGVESSSHGSLWLRLTKGGTTLLGEMLGNPDGELETVPGSLSEELDHQLLTDFVLDLLGRQSSLSDWVLQTPERHLFHRASGAASFTLSASGGESIIGLLSPTAVTALTRSKTVPAKARKPRLDKLMPAVSSGSLTLKAQLEVVGGLSFHAIKDLAVGDVVLLDQEIQTPWALTNSEGALIAHCQVGQRDHRLVVQLLDRASTPS